MKWLYDFVVRYPKIILAIIAAVTIFMVMQLGQLRWETDARVYMPKGHSAIKYDEKIEHLFGAKDAIVIIIKNDDKTIYNKETLERVSRISEKVATLPGVIANRVLDVASLSTATVFEGNDDSMGAVRLLENGYSTDEKIARLKEKVAQHADILVGNIVSADGSATMIRAKLKEGAANRYQTFWQIKGIVAAEGISGASNGWWSGNTSGDWQKEGDKEWAQGDQNWQQPSGEIAATSLANGDEIYLAGRPIIEVTSGLNAMDDMKVMAPLLVAVMALALFLIFKTGRGILIPLAVMLGAIVWTLGSMVLLDVPLYTISTMLPVILVAVGIGDSVHLLSHYYNKVLENPYRSGGEIVSDVVDRLGAPLITTSVTTAVGFLSLLMAEMPPFKIFGLFTVLGIFFSWLLTVTMAVALLAIMKPTVPGYHARKRSMRVRTEQDAMTVALVKTGQVLLNNKRTAAITLAIVVLAVSAGMSKLYVNSSWLSDFKNDSEVVQSTSLVNQRFDGALFLNIVVEANEKDGLKSPELLAKIGALQEYAETLEYVGDTVSVVDYLKSLNKTLHAMDPAYNKLPESQAEIAEGLYLYSVSGQPELLDEVIDFDYQRANITVSIKTDQTLHLKNIINHIKGYVDQNFKGEPVEINYAGSANNSYIWADLLIDSQVWSLLFSKVAILILAVLWFRSAYIGMAVVLPVVVATSLVGGAAGWLGITVDVSSVLAAGIAVGVGVDYAIHYVFSYTAERRAGVSHEAAVSETLRSVGRTIIFNAVVVVAGFSVLLMSQFPPHIKLGVFVVLYMVVSCIAALLVLPLFLRTKAHSGTA
jgi:hypothetical protein